MLDEPQDFYSAMYPLHLLCKYSGLAVWSLKGRPQTPQRKYYVSHWDRFLNVAIGIFLSVHFILANFDYTDLTQGKVSIFVVSLQLYGNSVSTFVMFFAALSHKKRIIKVITKLVWIEDQVAKITEIKNCHSRNFSLVHIVVGYVLLAPIIIGDTYLHCENHLKFGMIHISSYFVNVIMTAHLELFLFCILHEIRTTMSKMNHYLLLIGKNCPSNVNLNKALKQIEVLYSNLREISKEVNEIFQIQILSKFSMSFLIGLLTLYFFYLVHAEFVHRIFLFNFVTVYCGLVNIFELCLIVHNFDLVTIQAAKTAPLLKEAAKSVPNCSSYKQIDLFYLRFHLENLNFTACGLFELNWATVHSMAAAMVTYLVILIQFTSYRTK